MTCLILATKYYCETQDIVVNIDVCRLMGIRSDNSSSSPTKSYQEGADLLMAMELRTLDLINFDLYVSINEYNQTRSIFNLKIKNEKQAHEKETAADSQNGEINSKYLRKQRVYNSFNDLTNSKEITKI